MSRTKRPTLSEVIKSYGMRGYNGLKIKDIYQRWDNTARPIQTGIIIGMGNGACKFHNLRLSRLS